MFSNQNTKRESEYGVRSGLQPTGMSYLKPSPSTLTQTQARRSAQPDCSRQSAAQTVQWQSVLSSGSGLPVVEARDRLESSACATP